MILRTVRDASMLILWVLYISGRDHARKFKIQQLCSSAIYKQNDSISLRLSDSCAVYKRLLFLSMGVIFQLWNILRC